MTDCKPVIVAGSRFGQFYAAGIVQQPGYCLHAILGRGSERSHALAQRLGVPFLDSIAAIPADVRLACVAVGGAARGEQGVELACALMERGMDVVVEHPLLSHELQALLRESVRWGHRCLLNTFYLHLPAVAQFIALVQRLGRSGRVRHIDVACSVQMGVASLDIVGSALEGLSPWSVQVLPDAGECMRAAVLVLSRTPVRLQVLNELDATDDGRMAMLMRVVVTTDHGVLSLSSPFGPLIWTPAMALPIADPSGVYPLGGETGRSGELPPVMQIWHADAVSWSDVHSKLWPYAAGASLSVLSDALECERSNQRSLDVALVWQRIAEGIGFPQSPSVVPQPRTLHELVGDLV